MIVKTKGKKHNEVIIPTTTLIHNKPIKASRIQIPDDDKVINDTIEFDNIEIQPSKIKHNKPIKLSRNKIADDDKVINDTIDFDNTKILPFKKFFWPSKYMDAKDANEKLIQDFKPSSNYVSYNKIRDNNKIIDTIDLQYIEFLRNELTRKTLSQSKFNKYKTEKENEIENRSELLNELLLLIKK